jgi:hypothetical protein
MGHPRQPAEIIIGLIKGVQVSGTRERLLLAGNWISPCGQLRSVIKLAVFKVINPIKPFNHPDVVSDHDNGGLVLLGDPLQ